MTARRATPESAQKLEKKGNLEGAAAAYADLLQDAPNDTRFLLKLAELQEKSGQLAPANETFRRLGAAHMKEGFRTKAVSVLRRALKLVAHDVANGMMLSDALVGEGKPREAVEALQSVATASHARGDLPAQVALLQRAAGIDGSTPIELALAQALKGVGEHKKAAEHLQVVADRLRAQHAPADRLRVLEQLLELEPKNTRAAIEAAGLALEFRDGHRALVLVRRALDVKPDDLELTLLAGTALEIYGDAPRASRVFREAARVMTAAGDAGARAKEAWMAVLRVSPGDSEAHRAIAPAMAPDLAKLFAMRGTLLNDIGSAEADDAVGFLDQVSGEDTLSDDDVLDVSPEELETGYTLTIDNFALQPDRPLPVPAPALQLVPDPPAVVSHVEEHAPLQVDVETSRPLRTVNRAAKPMALPQRALVVGDDPEAGWALQALSDLGIDAQALPSAQLARGAERALHDRCDLVRCPVELLEVFGAAGGWLVSGPVQADRRTVRAAAIAGKAPVVQIEQAATAEQLGQLLEKWAGPAELVAALGPPVEVPAGCLPAFQLALARQQLGVEVWAQRPSAGAIWVVVAGDGEGALGLGEFAEARVEGQSMVISPSGEGEQERLDLCARVCRELGLRGVGVVRLVPSDEGGWAVESMEPAWGPGGLAVEARLGLSLVGMAVDLARGEALPTGVVRRGVAHAMRAAASSLGSLSNLRIETGVDGTVFLCAHANDGAQSARRLLRARQAKIE